MTPRSWRAVSRAAATCTVAAVLAARGAKAGPTLVRPAEEYASPVLDVSPPSLHLAATAGSTATAALTLKNAGGRVLNWYEGSGPAWLTLSRGEGRLEGGRSETVTVTVDASLLGEGRHSGVVVFEAPGAERPLVSVPVAVLVKASPKTPAPLEKAPQPSSSRHNFGVELLVGIPLGVTADMPIVPVGTGAHLAAGVELWPGASVVACGVRFSEVGRKEISLEAGAKLGRTTADDAVIGAYGRLLWEVHRSREVAVALLAEGALARGLVGTEAFALGIAGVVSWRW
jgi:hypothetical protein